MSAETQTVGTECISREFSIDVAVVLKRSMTVNSRAREYKEKAIEHRSNYVIESGYATISRIPTVGHYHCLNTAM